MHRSASLVLLVCLSFVAAAQTSVKPGSLDYEKSFEQRQKDINKSISNIGSNSSTAGSQCTKCPEACEIVCPSPPDSKCMAENKKRREMIFEKCRKEGRL